MAKQKRLTDELNLALSQASAAIMLGKDNPEYSQRACRDALDGINDAKDIMGRIMRAAEAI